MRQFPEGKDIGPYMKSQRKAIYIDRGRVNIRIVSNDGSPHNVMSYGRACILPIANRQESYTLAPYWRTEPAYGDVEAIVFPKEIVWELIKNDQRFSELVDQEIAERLAYLTFKPILYQDGDCINRISNYLIHLDICRAVDSSIPDTTQEELADVVGMSRSQVVRALAVLRAEGALKTQRKKILILDRQILMYHITETIWDLLEEHN